MSRSSFDAFDLGLERQFHFQEIKVAVREFFGDEQAGIGATVWSSSPKLSQWLAENRDAVAGKTVLELGSGSTGLCGITACLLGAKMVYLSDLEPVLESLAENASRNLDGEFRSRYSVIPLDWSCPERAPLPSHSIDVILAAECLYEAEMVHMLLAVVQYFKVPCLLTGVIGSGVYADFMAAAPQVCHIDTVSGKEWGERSIFRLTAKS
ncbi:hypothetical protein HDV03_005362 [Kappamyces sp. JEL0829]|nr:hypothetical protein HDV03_005362 [Kappamyces sp. JEL0829]